MDLFDIAVANKLSSGGGSSTLAVNLDQTTMTLDKTWNEINDAFPLSYLLVSSSGTSIKFLISMVGADAGGDYIVIATGPEAGAPMMFVTSDADGYPSGGDDDVSPIS